MNPCRTTLHWKDLTRFAASSLGLWLFVLAAGCRGEEVRASVTEFQLVNASGRAVFLPSEDFWLLVRGPTTLRATANCGQCRCDACDNCAVCGRAIAKVQELAPGAKLSFSWDGRVWPIIEKGCSHTSCQEAEPAARGPIDLHVTYSFAHGIDAQQGVGDDVIGEPVRAKVAFSQPTSAPVVVMLQ